MTTIFWPELFCMMQNKKIVAYGIRWEDGSCSVKWKVDMKKKTWCSFDDLQSLNNDYHFVFFGDILPLETTQHFTRPVGRFIF